MAEIRRSGFGNQSYCVCQPQAPARPKFCPYVGVMCNCEVVDLEEDDSRFLATLRSKVMRGLRLSGMPPTEIARVTRLLREELGE